MATNESARNPDRSWLGPVCKNATFFYGPHKHSPDLEVKPVEAFLVDLRALARHVHRELWVLWDLDVGYLVGERAVAFQLFTGAGDWHGYHTLVRVHVIGADGYIYLTFCFTDEPAPHWFVGANTGHDLFSPRTMWWQGQPLHPSYCMVRTRR